MSTTFDYTTGRVETDIHFKVVGEVCRLTSLPARIGNRYCTENCPFNAGSGMSIRDDIGYVCCTHEKAEDSPDVPWGVKHRFYDNIKSQALAALCY